MKLGVLPTFVPSLKFDTAGTCPSYFKGHVVNPGINIRRKICFLLGLCFMTFVPPFWFIYLSQEHRNVVQASFASSPFLHSVFSYLPWVEEIRSPEEAMVVVQAQCKSHTDEKNIHFPSRATRVDYYLGSWSSCFTNKPPSYCTALHPEQRSVAVAKTTYVSVLPLNITSSYENYAFPPNNVNSPFCMNYLPFSTSFPPTIDSMWLNIEGAPKYMYSKEASSYLEHLFGRQGANKERVVGAFIFGDGKSTLPFPFLRKARTIPVLPSTSSSSPPTFQTTNPAMLDTILYKAAIHRHFPPSLYQVPFKDNLPYSKKDNSASWRGTTTGKFYPTEFFQDHTKDLKGSNDGKNSEIHATGNGGYSSRAELIRRIPYYDSLAKKQLLNVDIGVTSYLQGAEDLWGSKQFLSQAEQMSRKIIIIAEGNDVSTGLKWALLSSSVVVMPKPSKVSWIMEELLESGIHYLEVAWDYSDLEEKVRWCFDHETECQMIGEKGRCWMESFLDVEEEDVVNDEVIEKALKLQDDVGLCKGSGESL